MSLLTLPHDELITVLGELSVKQRSGFALVSKTSKDLSRLDVLWEDPFVQLCAEYCLEHSLDTLATHPPIPDYRGPCLRRPHRTPFSADDCKKALAEHQAVHHPDGRSGCSDCPRRELSRFKNGVLEHRFYLSSEKNLKVLDRTELWVPAELPLKCEPCQLTCHTHKEFEKHCISWKHREQSAIADGYAGGYMGLPDAHVDPRIFDPDAFAGQPAWQRYGMLRAFTLRIEARFESMLDETKVRLSPAARLNLNGPVSHTAHAPTSQWSEAERKHLEELSEYAKDAVDSGWQWGDQEEAKEDCSPVGLRSCDRRGVWHRVVP